VSPSLTVGLLTQRRGLQIFRGSRLELQREADQIARCSDIIPLLYHPEVFGDQYMLKARVIVWCLIVSLSCVPLLAQSAADKDLLERIRKEEANNSQIMKTMHMLADVYGPRLTGTPSRKRGRL
jgi:hypothetical protein